MKTFALDIDQWTEATINQLITDNAQESLTVEFKRDLVVRSPSNRREVAKDVSALANTSGGWLIYGIDEQPNAGGVKVAAQIVPVVGIPDPGHRIDDILAELVHPPIPGAHCRIREIALSGGGVVIVVRVSRSPDDLHMVYGTFYRRSEQGARPLSEPEVRDAYMRIARRSDAVAQYVDAIVREESESEIPPSHATVLCLIPQTMREVVDVALLRTDDEIFHCLESAIWSNLSASYAGYEVVEESRRFRLRRDGSLVIAHQCVDVAGRWRPYHAMVCLMELLATAKRVWGKFGVIHEAVLSVCCRYPRHMPVFEPGYAPETNPRILPARAAFTLPVTRESVERDAASVVRRAMDRVYQFIGARRCPFFDELGLLMPDPRWSLKNDLARVGWP